MLRITRLFPDGLAVTVKLEGELVGDWVVATRDACTIFGRTAPRLRLDLAAVTFVDAAGVRLLRDLLAEGAEIATCSGFVGELLHRER